MTAATGQPGYFGPAGAQLFGVYHPPRAAADRDVGVVFCAPVGREYLKTHRALRQLALHAARAGFHALRFDYRGCGDSSGEAAGFGLHEWAQDVGAAVEELKDRAGVDRVALVGLRLGATLALLAAAARRDVEALVLWEPVLDGPAHLDEMARLDRAWWGALEIAVEPPAADGTAGIIGFPVGPRLRHTLQSLALAPARRPARRVLFLRGGDHSADAAFAQRLRELGAAADLVPTAGERIWLDGDEMNRALIPAATLQKAVAWLEASVA